MKMISLGLDTELISSALHNISAPSDLPGTAGALDMIKFVFTLKYVRPQPSNLVNPQPGEGSN